METINKTAPTIRLYKDGDDPSYDKLTDMIFSAGQSPKCPTYVHRTAPCQGACPCGHDIRGWLDIVRGIDKPKNGMSWQEYAFQRLAEANPFPAIMGRVCPHPCEDNCNRLQLDDNVGINSIEQYIGDWALENGLTFAKPENETGKKVAIIGGGPAGLAAAYFLRCKGHACTIFERQEHLGGMMRYGIPSYRTPRDIIDGEIKRIIDMGVEVRTNMRIGTDVTIRQLENNFDAVFWGIGAQSGQPLRTPGGDATNCVSGVAFLEAFNQGRLKAMSGRVLVIGGGDTAMDVAAVAKRVGEAEDAGEVLRPEDAIINKTIQDVARIARRKASDVWIVYRRPISAAPASREEIDAVIAEGVEIHEGLAPVKVIQDEDGRATALRVIPVDWVDGKMVPREGQEIDIKCSLIVAATGQSGDFTGIEEWDNGKGLMDSDRVFRVAGKPGHFLAGDIIQPHIMTAAIGDSWRSVDSIDHFLNGEDLPPRPRVDVHHFKMFDALENAGRTPVDYDHKPTHATDSENFAIHNYEDRGPNETVSTKRMFMAHFQPEDRYHRNDTIVGPDAVLDNFEERVRGLSEEDALAEANRCMSCGLCNECDNCIIYCPHEAVFRLKKEERSLGRYVDTEYSKCIGCHICRDVCPTGYIHMGLGE
jgi:NADPH-dependent glutamate synthase beta subunit-like oxidoreductase